MFKDSSQFYDYEILQLATAFTERRSGTIIFENIFVKTMTYLSRYVKNNTKGQIIP